MRLKCLVILLVVFSLNSYSQKQLNNWYFGSNAGLNFNLGVPIPLLDGAIDTIESCSVMSNQDGELLFYSDGKSIYNKLHIVMDNGDGLLGNLSATNGVIIIPFINDTNRYYVFTSDSVQNYQQQGFGLGVNYSIVNIQTNGGLGTVETKNVNVIPESSEKLTAIIKSDGSGYWLITHYQNDFYSISLTDTGIGSITTSQSLNTISNFNNLRGAIKISPNGKKIAITHTNFEPDFKGTVVLYDFNSITGEISNPLALDSGEAFYGLEFSSNSELLYVASKETLNNDQETGNTKLYQYNLEAPSIVGSRFNVTSFSFNPQINLAGGLQLASDGKIYFTHGGNKLSVINKPNFVGVESNFLYRAVNLGFKVSSLGLPLGVQNLFDSIIDIENTCEDESVLFFLTTEEPIDDVLWDFGDPISGPNNTSTELSPIYEFSSSGTYEVSATVNFSSGISRQYFRIVFVPEVDTPLDLTLVTCDIDGVNDSLSIFDLNDATSMITAVSGATGVDTTFTEYYISASDASLGINVIGDISLFMNTSQNQILYAKHFITLDCFRVIPVTLQVLDGETPPDIQANVCATNIDLDNMQAALLLSSVVSTLDIDFEEVSFYETFEDAIIQQSPINGFFVVNYPMDTIFYNIETDEDCFSAGTLDLTIFEPIEFLDQELIICSEDTLNGIVLEVDAIYEEYLWSTGEGTNSIIVFEPGVYTVDIMQAEGCDTSQRFVVTLGSELEIDIIINDFRQSNSIIVNTITDADQVLYSIDNGVSFQASNIFNDLSPGDYSLVVKDGDDCNSITQNVTVRGAPNFFTPNNDGYNDFWHIDNSERYPGMKVEIMDRFGKRLTSLSSTSSGWDGTYQGVLMPSNSYWYQIDYLDNVYYGYFSLIRKRQ